MPYSDHHGQAAPLRCGATWVGTAVPVRGHKNGWICCAPRKGPQLVSSKLTHITWLTRVYRGENYSEMG